MQEKYKNSEGINILKYYIWLCIIVLVLYMRSCVMAEADSICARLCSIRGENFVRSENKSNLYLKCYCDQERRILPFRQR